MIKVKRFFNMSTAQARKPTAKARGYSLQLYGYSP
jgi:hypothetical protein